MLGRSADVWGYPGSYLLGAGISALALPFVWLSRRQNVPADTMSGTTAAPEPTEVVRDHSAPPIDARAQKGASRRA